MEKDTHELLCDKCSKHNMCTISGKAEGCASISFDTIKFKNKSIEECSAIIHEVLLGLEMLDVSAATYFKINSMLMTAMNRELQSKGTNNVI